MSVPCYDGCLADFMAPDVPGVGAFGCLLCAPEGIRFFPGRRSSKVALSLMQRRNVDSPIREQAERLITSTTVEAA